MRRRGARWTDTTTEAAVSIFGRTSRTIATASGVALGATAVLTTLGLSWSANAHIRQQLDLSSPTVVELTTSDNGARRGTELEWRVPGSVTDIPGVVAAGTLGLLEPASRAVGRLPFSNPANNPTIDLVAASPGLFDALDASVVAGRLFDRGHDDRADPVAVLGYAAATRFEIDPYRLPALVYLDGRPVEVIGVIGELHDHYELFDSMILPGGLAGRLFESKLPDRLYIRTLRHTAHAVATQALAILHPNDPTQLTPLVAPEPDTSQRVGRDTNALFLALGALTLIVGALGIANISLVSVLERLGEIGLRRALGATRRNIATQFLIEALSIGAIGGALGALIAALGIRAVTMIRHWTPFMDTRLLLAAPGACALIGLLAGTYPAWRASAIEPITALRTTGL